MGPMAATTASGVKGNIRSNSAEFVRTALVQGLGLALRATWDIRSESESGALQVVLPEYHGSSKNAIHAVYPCREFVPARVNAARIEFLRRHLREGQGVAEAAAAWRRGPVRRQDREVPCAGRPGRQGNVIAN